MYYTKNAKDPHPELMEKALGCSSKQTATIQKETFQSIIKDSLDADEEKADKIFMEVQDNLSAMIEEHNAIYEDTNSEPKTLTNKAVSYNHLDVYKRQLQYNQIILIQHLRLYLYSLLPLLYL